MPRVKAMYLAIACLSISLATGGGMLAVSLAQVETGPGEPAVKRTRKMVRMLDDIYKTTVVLITDKYVEDEDDFPAGGAAIALFDAVKAKGVARGAAFGCDRRSLGRKQFAPGRIRKGGGETTVGGAGLL